MPSLPCLDRQLIRQVPLWPTNKFKRKRSAVTRQAARHLGAGGSSCWDWNVVPSLTCNTTLGATATGQNRTATEPKATVAELNPATTAGWLRITRAWPAPRQCVAAVMKQTGNHKARSDYDSGS